MNWRICTAMVVVALASGNRSAAQGPPVTARADEAHVSVAALEWFVDVIATAGKSGVTLVVSPVTTGFSKIGQEALSALRNRAYLR
jgi:hypothetical protein